MNSEEDKIRRIMRKKILNDEDLDILAKHERAKFRVRVE